MIKYIFLTIIIILFLLYIFIQFKFNFWSKQPVFHVYNLYYWIFPKGQILPQILPDYKFYDNLVQTFPFHELSTEKKALFHTFIKFNFLRNKNAVYNPPKHGVLDYFKYHNNTSFLSFYYHFFSPTEKQLVGTMSTRPLICEVNKNKINVGYVDFLCVHPKYRKKGIAPKIIHTHAVKCSKNVTHPIYIFKKEGDLNFIVPIVAYNCFSFSSQDIIKPNLDIENNVVSLLLNDSNIKLFYHYLKEIKDEFKCVIHPNLSNIKRQIKQSLLFIVLVLLNNEPVACYCYRNPHTTYNNKQSIELMTSYYTQGFKDLFLKSFSNSLFLINQKFKFKYILIENLSCNNLLIDKTIKNNKPEWECPMAYYFYNYSYRPFLAKDIFLLN